MSKGLEALEKIKNAMTIYVGCASNIYTRYPFECKEIEKELKELDERREMMKRFNEACVPMILDNETEKKLKALEIIKEKDVCVELLRYWWKCNYSDKDILKKYNYMHHWKSLTQEEYDLLKEVLNA